MSHYVYLLFSKSSNRYYVGSCANIDERLKRHNAGATPSSKTGRPWIVVYSEQFDTRSEAIKREYYIKRMKSRKYIENLIDRCHSNWELERPD